MHSFIKKKLSIKLFFVSLLISQFIHAQNFTWMKGSSSTNQVGSYGTSSVSAPGNVPGARQGAAMWADKNGNIWMFGGYGYSGSPSGTGYLNDLWRYNLSTGEWTFMHGTSALNQGCIYGTTNIAGPNNRPGGRKDAVTWVDANGNLWLFGGYGYYALTSWGTNPQNDLWKFDVTINQWTFVKGGQGTVQFGVYGTQGVPSSANMPGERMNSVGWSDALGNLWLFGGYSLGITNGGTGNMNDLWKYSISANQWTWMKGTTTASTAASSYGAQGITAGGNHPGGRQCATAFKDAQGKLWLYGGAGSFNTTSSTDWMNDLWQYDPATNNWTWMKGGNTANQAGSYGTMGVPGTINNPGARDLLVSWTDAAGDFWLMGGDGYGSATGMLGNYLNDFWKYNIASNQWTWINGSGSFNQPGNYGTVTVPAPGNMPGARNDASACTDNSGKLWLFGGMGNQGYQNDLWNFDVCYVPATPTNSTLPANLQVCAGSNGTLSAGSNLGIIRWYASATGTTVLGTGNSFVTPALNSSAVYYAEALTCVPSLSRTAIQVTVNALPLIAAYNGAVCTGNSFTINPSGAVTYTYSGGSAIVSPTITTSYSITGTSSVNCVSSMPVVITVTVGNTLNVSVAGSHTLCSGQTLGLTANGAATYSWSDGSSSNTLYVTPTALTVYTLTGFSGTCSSMATHSITSILVSPTVTANNGAICAGSSFTLNPSGAITYTYLNGANIVSPGVTTTYSISGTAGNGCVSMVPAFIIITVNPLPVIGANASTISLCAGNALILTGSGADTYTWSGGAFNGISFIPVSSAIFSVQGTNTLTGCTGTNNVTIAITVKSLPPVIASVTSSIICAGESATLTGAGASSYSWDSLNNNTFFITSPLADTSYVLTGTGANGCTNTFTIALKVDACTGINEIKKIDGFRIFPNPGNGHFTVQCSSDYSPAIFFIVNSLGQRLYEQKLSIGANEINVILKKDIYFYTISSDHKESFSGKLIID